MIGDKRMGNLIGIEYCGCGCGGEVLEGNLYIHGHNRKGLPSCTTNGRWAINYDNCIECNTSTIKHAGRGLCKRCYKKWFYKNSNKKNRWCRKYDKCVVCGRVDRPHASNGRCNTCHVNHLNRKSGVKKRNFGKWSWYHDKCVGCGTTEKKHTKHGLCYDCYRENMRRGYDLIECPVCGVKVRKLSQHVSMKSKRCKDHKIYQYNTFKKYFDSDLGLEDIAKEFGDMDRHTVSRQFTKLFGKEETIERNQAVKGCLVSERAKIGFNYKNRFGKIVNYDSLSNGVVRLRSGLEHTYAMQLDEDGVSWLYEHKSFPYIDEEGKRRTYTPDFYLVDTDEYVEIKGYDNGKSEYKIDKLISMGIKITLKRKEDLQCKTYN